MENSNKITYPHFSGSHMYGMGMGYPYGGLTKRPYSYLPDKNHTQPLRGNHGLNCCGKHLDYYA